MSRRGVVSASLAGSLLTGSLGAATGLALPDDAIGQAYLLVPPAPGNAYDKRTGNAYEDLATEAQLLRSDRVVDSVVSAGPDDLSAEQVRRRTRVSVVPGAEVVLITYRAGDPASAADIAGALADAMVAERTRRVEAAAATDEDLVSPRVAAARTQFARAVQTGDSERTVLLGRRLALLRAETAGAQASSGVGDQAGSILRVSVTRSAAVVPVVAGALGGGVLGLLAVAAALVLRRHRRGRRDGLPLAAPSQDLTLERAST